MAICNFCGQEMGKADSCTVKQIDYRDGLSLPVVEFFSQSAERCGDCNVANGAHHPGCSKEKCPRCHHQIIACRCELFSEIEEL